MKLNTDKRCKKYLYDNKEITPCKCSCNVFYSLKEYELVCKDCKLKKSPCNGTLFQNVRFGIVKAFEIAIFFHSENFAISSIKIAKKYGITQKTAYNFLKKINNNKSFINNIVNYSNGLTTIEKIKVKNSVKIKDKKGYKIEDLAKFKKFLKSAS